MERKIRIALFCLAIMTPVVGLVLLLIGPLALKFIGFLMLILGSIILWIVLNTTPASYEQKTPSYVPPPPNMPSDADGQPERSVPLSGTLLGERIAWAD